MIPHEGFYDSEVVIPLSNARKCLFFEEMTVCFDYLYSFCGVCDKSTLYDYKYRTIPLDSVSLFLLDYYSHQQLESLGPKKISKQALSSLPNQE